MAPSVNMVVRTALMFGVHKHHVWWSLGLRSLIAAMPHFQRAAASCGAMHKCCRCRTCGPAQARQMTEPRVDCSLLACSSTAMQQCSGHKRSAVAHIGRRCTGSHRLLRKRLVPMPCFHTRSQLFSQVP